MNVNIKEEEEVLQAGTIEKEAGLLHTALRTLHLQDLLHHTADLGRIKEERIEGKEPINIVAIEEKEATEVDHIPIVLLLTLLKGEVTLDPSLIEGAKSTPPEAGAGHKA
jgi:hypothetical protein